LVVLLGVGDAVAVAVAVQAVLVEVHKLLLQVWRRCLLLREACVG
jgi:hypothetical protein